jgi:transcriptional regulator with GAF, ATPase, and Fis domain/pSer/pThr/pTyr-binding forkhead associated (FHA) protein
LIRLRIEDQESVRSVEVNLDYLTLGRAPGCTLHLKDSEVGRFHASLERDGTALLLVPSGRGAGTWLNGRPVEDSAQVRVGDRMTLGRTHILLEAILAGTRFVPRSPDAPPPPEESPAPLPPDSALRRPEGPSLLEKSGVLRVFRRSPAGTPSAPAAPAPAAAPSAREAPPPPTPLPAAATGERTMGFSTEILRAPGSTGEEEAHALRRILDINKRLARVTEEERLLDLVLDAAVEMTGADRGLVASRGGEGEEPRVRRDRGGAGTDPGAWSAAARRALGTVRSVRLEGDGASHGPLLCVPLRGERDPLGVLYLDRAAGREAFAARDAALLEAFADQASLALQTAALVRENRERSVALETAGRRLEEANRSLEEALRARTVELRSAREEADRARKDQQLKYSYDRIVGRGAAMRNLLSLVDKVTDSAVPVLVEGESGTGKELVARAIHFNGPRARGPFVVENCAAVPEALIENELFGHEKGAFTGADRAQEGLFERGDGGTVFLDEVGDMSPEMQKKLLRVLQEGEVRRVGGKETRRVDCRILAATNRDLARMVKEGRFREDLFYRLCVVRIRIPPLRERREDVPLLAAHFLDRIAEEREGGAPRLEADALDSLTAHSWPGNVRELENEIRRAATLSDGVLGRDALSPHVREARGRRAEPGAAPSFAVPLPGAGEPGAKTLREAVEDLERLLLAEVLRETAGNKTRASRALGLSRLGLRKKMARYGMDG